MPFGVARIDLLDDMGGSRAGAAGAAGIFRQNAEIPEGVIGIAQQKSRWISNAAKRAIDWIVGP